jgi:predicted metal-dependent hydrolase
MPSVQSAARPRTPESRRTIRPRTPALELDALIPRHWLGGSPLATHLANGVNLLFPAGERCFVRSVRHWLDRVDDPDLVEQARGFFGQEGRHARAHEDFFEVLEQQGYRVRGFLRWYERIAYQGIERLASPELRLATTAALEHFTAILADAALSGGVLDDAHPAVRRLLLWHAAEEIEHKAVAFDVLARVAPGYRLRIAGLVLGGACLATFTAVAAAMLLAQDGAPVRRALGADAHRRRAWRRELHRALGRGVRAYLRPDFHPWDVNNYDVAARYMESAGIGP